jgi:hypothetical protein
MSDEGMAGSDSKSELVVDDETMAKRSAKANAKGQQKKGLLSA